VVRRQRLVLVLLVAAVSLPAYADRANDAYKHGVRAERQADYDAAYSYYKQAYTSLPSNPKYFAAYTRSRFSASTQHVHNGQLLRNTGALTEALAEFQHAVEIDGSSFIAQQELRRTNDMILRHERQRWAPKVDSPPAKYAEDVVESVQLQPISNAFITLHLTVNSDFAYKTLGKLAGINVALDPDYRPQRIAIDLNDVTLREALDVLALESKTFWRPVLPNTIFVAADSPAKRKEMEHNVMKTFYLRNVTSPNELQEAANLVRQMLDITRVQLVQEQDALILRGTPDQMVLAEKLLDDIDKPKAEVIIDVAVMEVSRDRIRTLGTSVPTSTSVGYLPGTSAGASGNASAGTVTLGNFALSVPGASFTFLASDSNTKILQNPEIRAVNNEKSTLKIGDRVPIATGSFQPGIVGGGGVSPLLSTQFQYLDVGVNIDITPHIHSDNEVTLKMVLEISSVTGSQNIGGITQPIIGQRRIEHETRLVDGDVNLLGGILEQQETQSLSGYPWISRLPILKYLFAQDNRERTENEIVFAITPHIVRAKEITDENLRVVDVGIGNSIELRRKPSVAATPPTDPAKPQPASSAAAPSAAASGSPRPATPSQSSSPAKPLPPP
jgi:general secretion pathway protein D